MDETLGMASLIYPGRSYLVFEVDFWTIPNLGNFDNRTGGGIFPSPSL